MDNYTFQLTHDEDVENPRDFSDMNVSTFCLFHNRYALPNEAGLRHQDYKSWGQVAAKLQRMGAVVILPVYGYDHSGLFMSVKVERDWWHYSWDGGMLGFIVVMGDRAREVMGWKQITAKRRAMLIEQCKAELSTYDQWQRGETYYVTILDQDGNEVESYGGLIGRQDAIENVQSEYPGAVEISEYEY